MSEPVEYVSTSMLVGSGTLVAVGRAVVLFRPASDLVYTPEHVFYVTQD